ncbi:hypothetical protein [Salinarimonas sp.]|uniref:hypothetical protein n=1 Tax=Salinarimonas sp. TaxID=2766526 RepID=UPI0032D97C26
MPRSARTRTPLSLALAAAIALPAFAPAAQAGEYWREEVIEHRTERRVAHRVDPYGARYGAQYGAYAPAHVAPRERGFDDDGAALALGIVGGVALGAVLGSVLARPVEPVVADPYASPYRDPYATPYADPYAGDPDIIPFERFDRTGGARPVGRSTGPLADGRYDPRGPRCQTVARDGFGRWGEPVLVEERVCR